jgi:hypothetical protein
MWVRRRVAKIIGKHVYLCKLLPLGKYNKARPQALQTPLPFEPREEMVIAENLEYMVEGVIPRIRSS